jgi:hypothetical protein
VYSVVENILTFTAGKYQYTVGNPNGAVLYSAAVTSGTNTLTGTVPADMIVGSFLSDNSSGGQNLIPAGTTVTGLTPGVVTMSNLATGSSTGLDIVTYTVPGDFAISRPIRITNAFTRITTVATGLDYPIDFEFGREKYNAIGLKSIQAPWPLIGWYNPTFPLGNLYFYPAPSGAGQLHLFTDTILSDFNSLTQAINLPQGYSRAIKKNLALDLAPEYGKSPGRLLMDQAKESLQFVRAQNATPAVQAFYDRDIVRAQRTDAGWILHGGFS